MKIMIRPSDIIKRTLWYKYEYFILDDCNKDEIEDIIIEDEEFEISEKDALVIGLLSCIETDNFVHRLNNHITQIMDIKSMEIKISKNKTTYCLRKDMLISEIEDFRRNFPEVWDPVPPYDESIEELNEYIDRLIDKIENDLDSFEETIKTFTNEYIQVNHLKKIMEFNNR